MTSLTWCRVGALLIVAGLSIGCLTFVDLDEEYVLDPWASSSSGDGPSVACVPSMNTGKSVDERCGVFVSVTGDDEASGTKGEPFQTLGKALAELPKQEAPPNGGTASIYLCAQEFEEEVTLPAGVRVYGGLDCEAEGEGAWVYKGTALTRLTAGAGKVPLRLAAGAAETLVSDVRVLAQSVPKEMAGVSSIAVIADGVTARFERSVIEAGDGAAGVSGEAYANGAANGMEGVAGEVACSAAASMNKDGPETMCAPGVSSLGGNGGVGSTIQGNPGTPGEPGSAMNGGVGESSMGVACTDGTPGDAGAEGKPGADASGSGKLDSASGWIGLSGESGSAGGPGQGGGGGGGAKSRVSNVNQCPGMMGVGASGGSGGSGGCGGEGGKGGGPGGASIAVVSIASTLTFSASTLKVGNGGAPGEGGAGQAGGMGGAGAPGGGNGGIANLKPGCAGGAGGMGGAGGKGGRGLGGHAMGIAHRASEHVLENGSVITIAGAAGAGGAKAEMQEFPAM